MIQPRYIRLKDAPDYLGMDKNRFNAEVRPYITEIPLGKGDKVKVKETRAVAFDRLDLDKWADDYKARYGRGPGNRKGDETWGGTIDSPDLKNGAGSTGSTSTTKGTEGFTKALGAARATRTNGRSRRSITANA